jgi:hypothetical protein
MHHRVPQPHGQHRFARWQRLMLQSTGSLLLLSGLAWLALHYGAGAGAGELPHPLEVWFIRLHGLAAQAGLFMLGTVAAAHLPSGWQASRRPRLAPQRRSGLLLCTLALLLAGSGYLLYYFAPEWLRPALGAIHAGLGLAMALGLAVHVRGARTARSAHRARCHGSAGA